MDERSSGVVLLDLDGVLLDNAQYDAEWRRLAGDAFAPLLGGDPALWAAESDPAWRRVSGAGLRALETQAPAERPSPAAWWDRMNAEWIAECCRRVGVPAPRSPHGRVEVAEAGLAFFFEHTRTLLPGGAAAIRALAARFEIHMASGNPAWVCEAVLRRLGVRDLVGHPFGSDLAGALKNDWSRFYGAILSRVGAPAERAIVVDDDDTALAAARALGARTAKVGLPGAAPHDWVVEALADLPPQLEGVR